MLSGIPDRQQSQAWVCSILQSHHPLLLQAGSPPASLRPTAPQRQGSGCSGCSWELQGEFCRL